MRSAARARGPRPATQGAFTKPRRKETIRCAPTRRRPGSAAISACKVVPDFHFIAVHFQAGDELSSIERRDYAVSGMQTVIDDAMTLVPDSDVVFCGRLQHCRLRQL